MNKVVVLILAIVVVIVGAVAIWLWVERVVQNGVVALKNGDGEVAISHFERASLFGSANAKIHLAEMHALGIAVVQDRNKALQYYNSVPIYKLVESIQDVVYALREGHHALPDAEEAAYWESWLEKNVY